MIVKKWAALLAAGLLLSAGNAVTGEAYYLPSGEATITDKTYQGDTEFAVDNGATLNLRNVSITTKAGQFSLQGGIVNADHVTAKDSGIWVSTVKGHAGTAIFKNSTFNGGTDIAVQGKGAKITFDNTTANIANAAVTNTGLIDDKPMDASDQGPSSLTLQNQSKITAQTLTVSGGSSLALYSGSALDISGSVTIDEDSSFTIDGAAATIKQGAALHVTAGAASIAAYAAQSAPVSIKNGGKLVFEANSAAYTTADANNQVRTVAAADASSTITVTMGAALYVTNAKADNKTKYDISTATTKTTDKGTIENTSWDGDVFGDTMRIKLNKDTGLYEIKSYAEAYEGLLAANAMQAAHDAGKSAASDFIAAAEKKYQSGITAADKAHITEALNSAAGLTGLSGIGYGLVSFTDDLARSIDNHDADESGLWASYLHDKRSADGLAVGNLGADYDITFDGAVVGADFAKTGSARYGAAISYAAGETSANGLASTENKADYYGGALYGVWTGDSGLTYKAELGYTKSENDITQWNSGAAITANADADAFYAGVRAEKSYTLQNGTLTPYLGVRYTDLSVDSYTDSLGFAHDSDSAGLWNLPFGVVYRHEIASASGWTFAPEAELGYQLAFGDKDFDETISYGTGADTFGIDIGENSFIGRLGLTAVKENLAFGIHYGYQKGSDTQSEAWGLTASLKF